jgi:hypothetical protein
MRFLYSNGGNCDILNHLQIIFNSDAVELLQFQSVTPELNRYDGSSNDQVAQIEALIRSTKTQPIDIPSMIPHRYNALLTCCVEILMPSSVHETLKLDIRHARQVTSLPCINLQTTLAAAMQ